MLGASMLEDLARTMVRTEVLRGDSVIREGERGDE
jgi:hypothetical protein